MSNILTKEKQHSALVEKSRDTYLLAIMIVGIFTFLFLCTEYLFVDILSASVSESRAVSWQNYALGVSAAGFVLYPLFNRLCTDKIRNHLTVLATFLSMLCVCVMCWNLSYHITVCAGLVLFLLLGMSGSAVFATAAGLIEDRKYLARIAGVAYMAGIMLQFVNNNLVASEKAEAVVAAVFLLKLNCILMGNQREAALTIQRNNEDSRNEDTGKCMKMMGLSLVLLIVLMSCMFSTLDNAVTLVHASGAIDIGQLPRILLAVSGVAAGIIFDLNERKYMSLIMYCMMMLSTICIAVIKFSGPFLAGLIIFYITAGFFVVFFTTSFMEYSYYTDKQDLWAGLGRAVNNITAVLITGVSLHLLSFGGYIAMTILVVFMFVAVSVVTAMYMYWRKKLTDKSDEEAVAQKSETDRLQSMVQEYGLTPRETEALSYLVTTEDSIQAIAESMYVSKRTLERHISAIYEKTGVKTRVGLMNLYNK